MKSSRKNTILIFVNGAKQNLNTKFFVVDYYYLIAEN